MLAYLVFLLVERVILRMILVRFRANKGNTKTIVLVGNERTVHQLYEILKTPIYGYNIAGFFYDGECENEEIASMRLGGISDIYGWIATHPRVNEIYGYSLRNSTIPSI